MSEQKYIKYINFDLDTKELLKIFPDGTREPYAMLKTFFEDRGFTHRQYSGYVSKEPLDNFGIFAIMEELGQKFTWLKNCIQEFDVSNVINEVSVKDQIINSALQQEKQNKLQKTNTTQKSPKILPLTPKPKSRKR